VREWPRPVKCFTVLGGFRDQSTQIAPDCSSFKNKPPYFATSAATIPAEHPPNANRAPAEFIRGGDCVAGGEAPAIKSYLCGGTNRAHLTVCEGGNSTAAGHESLAAQATFPWHLCCAGIGFGDCGLHPMGCLRHGFFLMCVALLDGPNMTMQKGHEWGWSQEL
jgi:hypothetical protein